jgi:hypothetical protein
MGIIHLSSLSLCSLRQERLNHSDATGNDMTSSNEVFEFGYRNGRQLSHFLVDVTAYDRENLARVMAVAFSDIVSGKRNATHFALSGAKQLVLFSQPPSPRSDCNLAEAAEEFPEPLNLEKAVAFVWEWLQRVEYPQDEHDGTSKKGWRVFNEQFGIVGGCWEAFIAIRPMWIYIPK